MFKFKKFLAVILLALVATATLAGPAAAMPDTLYQTSSRQTITAGATLEHLSRFTADGWLNIKVLRIDTSNPNIRIDTLANQYITDKPSPVPDLARQSGAVAAVNSAFFNPLEGGKAYPDGPIVKAGEMLSTAASYNKSRETMASFSLDKFGQMFFNYWTNDLILTGSNNTTFAVSQYNQPSLQQYNDITVLDNKWGPTTPGVSEKYPDWMEILVSQGKVQEVRKNQPPAAIPAEGFAVISRGEQANRLLSALQVGSSAKFTVTSNPDWASIEMSTTGASILVKDGKIPEKFTYSTGSFDKKNPRTLLGSTRDGKELILVTVDGRQDNSVGLTQTESAELMLELGAYNALILDGGGSTTMVARQPGTNSLEVVNVPSEGSLRGVTTGIGIFSLASPGQLAELILETDDLNVFVNTGRKMTLRGVDRFANPVEISPDKVKWSVSGIKGSFQGNVFYPASAGQGKITAKVGDLTAEIEVRSLSSPVRLALMADALQLKPGQSRFLPVAGYDQDGFSARIQPEDIRWTVSGGMADCQNGVLTASSVGSGYVKASVGKVYAAKEVTVFYDETNILHSFEENQAVFQANPQVARGSWEISAEQVQAGQSAGQLIYDFFESKGGEVSLAFAEKGLKLAPDTGNLTLWVYNTQENDNRILGEVLDAAGQKHQVEFAQLNWKGWKQTEASLQNIKEPQYLTRLYLKNTDPGTGWGKIYLDDLAARVSRYPAASQSQLPPDTVPQDKANKSVKFTPGPENFRFSVFGSAQEPGSSLEAQLLKKLAGYINGNLDMAVYAGDKASEAAQNIKKPVLITGTEYKTVSYKNSSFIQLDISKGGLRRSDPQQWTWLFKELDNLQGSNAFIVLAGDLADFINAKEAQLLKDTLADYRQKTGKNVWVFYQGAANQSQMDRGVRYISSAGFGNPEFSKDNPKAAKYLQVTVKGKEITFEFKSI